MNPIRRQLTLAMLGGLATGPAWSAQSWQPSKPIRLIVAYAPGGSADVLARLVQPGLSEELGTNVYVENRPGGAGNVGTAMFAHAAPDGYTIGIGSVSSHAINPALFGDQLPFRVPDDFTPIVQLISQPNALIVHPSVPATNMRELVEWLKANPGQGFGTAGTGSSSHLIGEMLNEIYGVKLVHAPYKSGGLSLQDLLGGHIKILIDNVTTAASVVPTGRGRAIAVSSARRSSRLPDVPTFAEQGAPGMDLTSWQGLFGPANLPPEVTQRINMAARNVLNVPAIRQRLQEFGSEPIGSSPEAFQAFVNAELPKWGALVKRAGLKPS